MIKKKHKKASKFLLETSVQIDKIINSHVRKQIDAIKPQGNLRSSYFVFYEFKAGLIKNLINFYFLVEITGLSQAIFQWQDSFKPREVKGALVALGVILNLEQTISEDDALPRLEAVIMYIFNNFESDIQNKQVGDFVNDPIVKYKIESRADFQGFLDLYKQRKCIPLNSFFQKNSGSLDKILSAEKLDNLKNKTLPIKLKDIKSNPKKANKYHVNKAVGDAVISIDTPNSYTLVTLDTDYNILCGSLGKEIRLLKKKA